MYSIDYQTCRIYCLQDAIMTYEFMVVYQELLDFLEMYYGHGNGD